MIEVLREIKELLTGLEVNTIKIGIEANISPSDYPIVRIVAKDNALTRLNGWSESLRFDIFAGFKLDEKIGLEAIYEKLYNLEFEIRKRLHNKELKSGLARFEKTISDEDRLKNFKVLCISFSVFEIDIRR